MTRPTTSHTSKTMLSHLTLAGAAALTASSANAQIMVVPVNENVGFAPGDLTTLTLAVPGLLGTSFIRFYTRQYSYVGSVKSRFRTILEHDKGSASVLMAIGPNAFGAPSSRFLATAPVAVPGIVLGVGLFLSYTRPPFVLYGTLWILLIAFLTINLPSAYQQLQAAFATIHPELEDASRIANVQQSILRV